MLFYLPIPPMRNVNLLISCAFIKTFNCYCAEMAHQHNLLENSSSTNKKRHPS